MPEIRDQKVYWEVRHKNRKVEHELVEMNPTPFALRVLEHIPPKGLVLEVGCANGRDARYFIRSKDCSVIATDFSIEAIRQLQEAAVRDNTSSKLVPFVSDARHIFEVFDIEESIDVFYSRSALHLNDEDLKLFFGALVKNMKAGGIIAIQGKPKEDFKVAESEDVDGNLAIDSNGHVRRVWSQKQILDICSEFNLELQFIEDTVEIVKDKETRFIGFSAKKK